MAPKKKILKSENEIIENMDVIDQLVFKINKELDGKGKIMRASEVDGSFILRRPTMITSLDLEIGGGIPAKGVTQLVGSENSGKTALAYTICGNVQRIYQEETRIALLMVEGFDKSFAKNLNFQIAFSDKEIDNLKQAYKRDLTEEELLYLKKEIGKVYYIQYPTAEALLQAALGLIESNKFHVIVIDSLAAMETEAESEKTLDEFSRGGVSKTLSMFFKKLCSLHFDTSIIMINQLRDNMDAGLYGKKYVIPGGRALKHGNFLTIVLSSGERLKETINNKEVMYGKETHFVIDKGKAGCHDGGKGGYIFYNGELGRKFGIDIYQDLLMVGVYYGVITRNGNHYTYKEMALGNGKENASLTLRSNIQLVDEIRNEIFALAGVKYITKEDNGKRT